MRNGIVHVLKAVTIVTSKHLNLSTIFVISHFLTAKVSPTEGRIPVLGLRKSVPL